jgi:light-regulated signal transduction histidine kinase (bacteriophytochrome)
LEQRRRADVRLHSSRGHWTAHCLNCPARKPGRTAGAFEKLKRGERIEALETSRIAKDGRRLTISLSLSPIHDARGKVVGISGIDRDITARKAAEEALEEAQQRVNRYAEELELQVAERTKILKETVQSLEGVCYTIAHDLRAPLRTLQGFTRILLEDYASAFDEEGRIYAERIVAAATRMDTLIRDLLEFAKLSHLELPLVSLNLGQQVQQVLGHMAGEIEAKGAEIIVQRLPRVIANATVLNQVLSNLIGNALKFVAENVRPKIEMWAETIDGRARLFIKDNGIGIDAIHHERIFGLFQRLHKPEVYPGTGIGLAIVRKGMERMGGSVGLQSGFGHGSCFYIDLRLVSEQMDEADRPNGR